MSSEAGSAVLGASQVLTFVAFAPLLNGFIKKVKARLQLRRGPPLLQGYADIAKWLTRAEQVADTTGFVHRLAPFLALAAILAAVLMVPVFTWRTPLTASGDLFVVVGLLALARAALTLGAMDSGSSFGQMGSSRELAIGALVEPVLVLSLLALTVDPQSTRLGDIVAFGDGDAGRFLTPGWALATAAFAVVVVAETGRIPVDNPDTHLELTMVHEGMLIEYSGRALGFLTCAAMVRQLLLVVVLVNVFLPFGLAHFDGIGSYAFGAGLLLGKVALAGIALAALESSMAKLRLFQVPDLIGAAALAAILGVALTVLFT